jgi:hypothetical protein
MLERELHWESEALREALDCLAQGISQIPLGPRSKRPPTGFRWAAYQTRLPTEGELYRWFVRGGLNRGIVTGAVSGLVVVDADSRGALAYATAKLPPTPMQSLTRCGAHLFFRHPGVRVRNGVKLKGMPLDVRGDGGYVVAPGSVHPSGFVYRKLGDWYRVRELPVFDPAWLAGPAERGEPCRTPRSPRPPSVGGTIRDIRAYIRRVPSVQGQNGSRGLMRVCYLLADHFGEFDPAMAELIAWNAEVPNPPWDEGIELVRALSRALRRRAGEVLDRQNSASR